MILYSANPKVSIKNIRNEFSKVAGYKINIQKSFMIASKRIKYLEMT